MNPSPRVAASLLGSWEREQARGHASTRPVSRQPHPHSYRRSPKKSAEKSPGLLRKPSRRSPDRSTVLNAIQPQSRPPQSLASSRERSVAPAPGQSPVVSHPLPLYSGSGLPRRPRPRYQEFSVPPKPRTPTLPPACIGEAYQACIERHGASSALLNSRVPPDDHRVVTLSAGETGSRRQNTAGSRLNRKHPAPTRTRTDPLSAPANAMTPEKPLLFDAGR